MTKKDLAEKHYRVFVFPQQEKGLQVIGDKFFQEYTIKVFSKVDPDIFNDQKGYFCHGEWHPYGVSE